MAAPVPFFTASDHLGRHAYFRSVTEAEAYQAVHGGAIAMTTPHRIWRVTQQNPRT